MAFISVGFYLFVAAMVAVYYLFPLRWRWVVLLGASMGFYCYLSAFSAANITMLLAAALLAWILALWQRRWPRYKRLWLTLAVAASAIPLLIIKEMPFFLSRTGSATPGWFIVPVGIAFYSLQLIAYAMDIYRGTISPQQNFFKFLLFVSFFPSWSKGTALTNAPL
ncbi:MAG: hypothetical protein DBX91_09230 [Subdoligranulum variabile]|nr:MAG: hypothetical protein DBX91_09230 [Subdoligranulum variabile]